MVNKLKNSFLLPLLGREQEILSLSKLDPNVRNAILFYISPPELIKMRNISKEFKSIIDDTSPSGLLTLVASLPLSYHKKWLAKLCFDSTWRDRGIIPWSERISLQTVNTHIRVDGDVLIFRRSSNNMLKLPSNQHKELCDFMKTFMQYKNNFNKNFLNTQIENFDLI